MLIILILLIHATTIDSSEMLPGSQKGEENAGILKTHTQFRHFGSPYALYYRISMFGTGNDHVTAARCNRRASRENGESQQVTYPDGKLI